LFNAEQCDELPAHYYAKAEAPALPLSECIEAADTFFAATGVDIRQGGIRAYYAEGPDYVQMPPFETFGDADSHAAALAHELIHSTKHRERLVRDLDRRRMGDPVDQNLRSFTLGTYAFVIDMALQACIYARVHT
jgi:antirestriction protein ArdC